eukprot:scpid86661/ scgid10197/ Nucleotide-binding oligomerization domain-containing protein 2; Caspase recruitment domain-containing protein 15
MEPALKNRGEEPAAERKPFPGALIKARTKLRELTEECGIQLSDGLANDQPIPLEQIFVNLSLVSEKVLKSEFEKQLSFSTYAETRGRTRKVEKSTKIELKDLFEGDHTNVLAYGAAGSGKTTVFLRMVLYLWSKSKLWREHFDLILGLELREREVRAAKSLTELLALKFASLGMSDDDVAELSRHLEDRLDRLCVILDGLDECDVENCSMFMRDLLKRKGLVKARVIVTTRVCTDANHLSQCGRYQKKIEVLGFSEENVQVYTEKVLGAERAAVLLAQLQNQPDVKSLMATPIFAALTCELFEHNKGVCKCSTALHESMLLRAAERAGDATCKSFSTAPTKFVRSLYELGRFAFCMLLLKRLVFDTCDIASSHLSKDALDLGLLQTCRGARSTDVRQYRFGHLSLQEFLAAWYIAKCLALEKHHATALVRRVGYQGHMAMFWKFL